MLKPGFTLQSRTPFYGREINICLPNRIIEDHREPCGGSSRAEESNNGSGTRVKACSPCEGRRWVKNSERCNVDAHQLSFGSRVRARVTSHVESEGAG